MIHALLLLTVQVEYEKIYLFTLGNRQDTLVFDLNGDGQLDILNTSIDYSHSPPVRWLLVHYAKNGRFEKTPNVMIVLPEKASCLLFGNFDPNGGVEICYITSDGIYYYPFENNTISEKPKKLIHTRTFFEGGTTTSIPLWFYPVDLDGNNLDDIILPIPDGYKIYLQTATGVFGRTFKLEAEIKDARRRETKKEEFVFKDRTELSFFSHMKTMPRPEVFDMNGDGKKDIVVLHKDKVTTFFQDDKGNFVRDNPRHIPILKQERSQDVFELPDAFFKDVNNDKKPDLVIIKNRYPLGPLGSIETQIFIHYGDGKGDFTGAKSLNIRGTSLPGYSPQFTDLNNDGYLDIFSSRVDVDIFKKVIEQFIMRDIAINFDVYQFIPLKGEHEFVETKEVYLNLGEFLKNPLRSLSLVIVSPDLTKDGRPDLVVADPKGDNLKIFRGKEKFGSDGRSEIGFEKDPEIEIKLDRHPRWLSFQDVNNDGLNDIILYHKSAVGLLLSKK